MLREAPLEQPGALIASRYEVEETLGRGGMAVVYRVRDTQSGRVVALKRGWAREPEKLQRNAALLEREYYTLAQLAHPRIIAVYDYGRDVRGPYYTMELLDGSDLERTGQLPWQTACAVLRDVATSLAILHSRGLVHRDVSSRNVRYAAAGHVKLLDFGAMISFGVARDIVGTPRFMAPEVLAMQTLDARADLFALGALGYYLLTGRDAYPARRISDLRDHWRSRPQPPARVVADVPAALSALILRLIAIDRSARPGQAAEVIEQLIAVADLPRVDTVEISHAYLSAPTLVARDRALIDLRRQILSLARGDGGVLMVRGVSGSGRSRMLDACALEARMLGATVIRADARDAASGDWGVARAITAQLLTQLPQQAQQSMRLSRDILGHVVDDELPDVTQPTSGAAFDRYRVIRELRDFVVSLARPQGLLLVIDDADRIDEPSLACLAAISYKVERNPVLLVVATGASERPATAATLRLLKSLAQLVELSELEPDQTETLLRTVFGEVRSLPLCAARIHELSHGNPGAILELAQHLVDTGCARFEAGSWTLPDALDETDLPASLTESLAARLSPLGDDARELLDALVLADGDTFAISDYRELCSHTDMRRVFSALDALSAARVVVVDGERCNLSQRGFLSVVQQAIPPARRRLIHGRIADLLTRSGGDVSRRAHHALAAGRARDAIELLCGVDLSLHTPPLPLLAAAIAHAEALQLPARTLQRLRMALLTGAPFTLAADQLRSVAPVVVRQLDRDSGLLRYRELAHLPPAERLSQALAQTHQAYLATPEPQRVHSVIEALGELARVAGAILSMVMSVFEYELFDLLPDLEALRPLSPALQVMADLVTGAKYWVRGRMLESYFNNSRVLARIGESDRAGLDDGQHQRVRLGLEYALGLGEATQGVARAELRAKEIERDRDFRVNAWRIRTLFQLAIGNPADARKCSRRAQLLQAQEGAHERYVGSTPGMELLGYARLKDLLGVKSLLDALGALAAEHVGWAPVELFGWAVYAALQHDWPLALQLTEAALTSSSPLGQPFWATIAAQHLDVLRELGRGPEACQYARSYFARCSEEQLMRHDLGMAAALALGRFGEHAEALAILAPLTEQAERLGRTGLALGAFYLVRARIALWANDRPGFDAAVERCSALHDPAKYPAIATALAPLIDEARQHGLLTSEVAATLSHSLRPATAESEYETIHGRMSECLDTPDRARCALTLLLQSTVSATGYLYGMGQDGELRLLAAVPDLPSLELEHWVRQYARDLSAEDERATDNVTADGGSTGSLQIAPRFVDGDGRQFEPALLFDAHGDGQTLVAALVLEIDAHHRSLPSSELRSRIARELSSYGDVRAAG